MLKILHVLIIRRTDFENSVQRVFKYQGISSQFQGQDQWYNCIHDAPFEDNCIRHWVTFHYLRSRRKIFVSFQRLKNLQQYFIALSSEADICVGFPTTMLQPFDNYIYLVHIQLDSVFLKINSKIWIMNTIIIPLLCFLFVHT